MANKYWLRRWVLLLWALVCSGGTFFSEAAFANLGSRWTVYDRANVSHFVYDATYVLALRQSVSETHNHSPPFVLFTKFLAAEGAAGLETQGLRPLPGTRQIPAGIPDIWRIRPTQGEGGTLFYDPTNKGNAVRVMQGDPSSPFPNSQSPYVRWQRNGQALEVNGNVVPRNSPDAHIPLQNYKFKPSLYK
jgi:hypothetical protein